LSLNQALFSSKTHMWETPQDFYDLLNNEFSFELDVCAIKENAKCDRYFSPEDDGLKQVWSGTCWMNPPYGRKITGQWIRKAYEEAQKPNTTVVCLIPSRTDTKYWHEFCMKGEIRFVKGRLKFGDAKESAPFPSVVVIFGEKAKLNSVTAMVI